MKNPVRLSWRVKDQLRTLVIAAFLGAIAGIFILYPTNEFVYFYEHRPLSESTPGQFALSQLQSSLRGGTPKKTGFYAIVGLVLSVSAAAFYSAMHRRSERIEQLSAALGDDLRALIARGESANLEFKSSFRWDLRENKVNRALEAVVLKTLAGYMNGSGGTLLIGVADDGSVTGLHSDYQTLKKPDRDGFEQVLMTAIATKLGGDACHAVQMVFHSLESKDVCRVMVAASHRPVYLKDGDSPRLYVRTGVSTRELNVQEAINYTSARWPK
jgi:Schlafen, AlbA_2